MVVGGCRSFLLVVTTENEVNNCAKVTLDGRYGDFVRVYCTNFHKIHFPLLAVRFQKFINHRCLLILFFHETLSSLGEGIGPEYRSKKNI